MSREADDFFGFMFFLLCIGMIAFVIFMIGYDCRTELFQKEAVEHGAAHYDETTGEWQWNNPRKAD